METITVREDERAANEFMKKYGTIYNLAPKSGLLGFLVLPILFLGVPYLIYQVFYEKRAK